MAGNFNSNYGFLPVVDSSNLREKLQTSSFSECLNEHQDITLIVGSKKRAKIVAGKQFFESVSGNDNISVQPMGVQARSGIADQPTGLQNGLLGCINRISDSKNFVPPEKGVYYFASENFLSESTTDDGLVNYYTVIIIENDAGIQHQYLTDGLGFPADIFQWYKSDEAMCSIAIDETGFNPHVGELLERKFGLNSSSWLSELTQPSLSEVGFLLTATKNFS